MVAVPSWLTVEEMREIVGVKADTVMREVER